MKILSVMCLHTTRELITKSFKLQLVVSECSAHCSGVAGALHLEEGYCYELTIFMTSTSVTAARLCSTPLD